MFDSIKTAYALKNGVSKRSVYNWRAPVFLFTNENISGYLKQMGDMSDKKILTVAGSGDHVFESILAGAEHVDTFDVNYLQKHIVELKSKMIKYLPYSDFMRFFFDKNHFFDKNIIKPIWNKLSLALRVFLNYYYANKNISLFRYRNSQHNMYSVDKISYIKDEQAYAHLGKIMPEKISFKQADVSEISNRFDSVYDIILLSNIFGYLYEDIEDMAAKVLLFRDGVLSPIADKNLNPNGGKICFNYTWQANPDQFQKMAIVIQHYLKYSIDNFDSHNHHIDFLSVPSAMRDDLLPISNPDVVLTMTQKAR